MMRDLHIGISLRFDNEEERTASEDLIVRLMSVIARNNYLFLLRNPNTPRLYDSGIVYAPPDQADGRPKLKKGDLRELLALIRKMGADPETALMIVRMMKGLEVFLDIPALLRRGKGDCNELVPMRVAELWRAGVACQPWLVNEGLNSKGGISYHVVVKYDDESSEDPSLILGMNQPGMAAYRREECRKNAERYYIAASQGLDADAMGLVPKDGVFRLHHSGPAPAGARPKVIDASEWAQVSGRRRLLRAA